MKSATMLISEVILRQQFARYRLRLYFEIKGVIIMVAVVEYTNQQNHDNERFQSVLVLSPSDMAGVPAISLLVSVEC